MQTIFSFALLILFVLQTCGQQQIICDIPIEPARVEHILSLVKSLDNANCTSHAGSGLIGCTAIGLNESFIVRCNTNSTPNATPISVCSMLGEIAHKTFDQCHGENSTLVKGAYYDAGINLCVSIGLGNHDCSTFKDPLTP